MSLNSILPRLAALSLVLAAAACDQKQPAPSDAKPPVAANTPAGDKLPTDKPAAADPKVKVVEGADPTDDRYTLKVEPPAEARAGQEGTVVVTVVPKDPWHMNLDFPTVLALAPPDGVTLAKKELRKEDGKLDEKGAAFDVKFTPAAAGDKAFTGKFKFAVCQEETCAPVTEELAFRVAVK